MYFVLILLVTFLTLTLPRFAPKIAAKWNITVHPAPAWLPIVAAVVYFTSLYLPDIGISPETDTFQQHFIGGGVYTALLYIYFSRLFGWHPHWSVALLALFAWTSALGVLNEVLEFILNELNITRINTSDTDWDLFANTAGALVTFLVWQATITLRGSQK